MSSITALPAIVASACPSAWSVDRGLRCCNEFLLSHARIAERCLPSQGRGSRSFFFVVCPGYLPLKTRFTRGEQLSLDPRRIL